MKTCVPHKYAILFSTFDRPSNVCRGRIGVELRESSNVQIFFQIHETRLKWVGSEHHQRNHLNSLKLQRRLLE